MDFSVAAGADSAKLLMEEKHREESDQLTKYQNRAGLDCGLRSTQTIQCLGVWKKGLHPDGGEAMGRVGTEVSDGTAALERPQHNTTHGFRMGFQIFQARAWCRVPC